MKLLLCAVFTVVSFCLVSAVESKVYIPKNLSEAHTELLKILQKEDIEIIRNGSEAEMGKYHHGFGTWHRNN